MGSLRVRVPVHSVRHALGISDRGRWLTMRCHGTRYVRHTQGRYAYGVRTVAQQLPCAAGTYATQEAGTCSLYVQYGGSGTYRSAQWLTMRVRARS